MIAERPEGVVEGAGPIVQREAETGLVVAAGLVVVLADDQEAGDVARIVLDVLGDDRQLGVVGGESSGDGGGLGFPLRQLDGADGAGDLDEGGIAQIGLQIFAALAERLRMAVDAAVSESGLAL